MYNLFGKILFDLVTFLRILLDSTTHFFLYKNLFPKNVEAEIYQNFKNKLRKYPWLRVGERSHFARIQNLQFN